MNSLKTDDFDFELDESLIAQFPLKDRSSSKLLVVNRENFNIKDIKWNIAVKVVFLLKFEYLFNLFYLLR